MSMLSLRVVVDREDTAAVWSPEIARKLREIANQVEAAPGAVDIRVDWPELEAWGRVPPAAQVPGAAAVTPAR